MNLKNYIFTYLKLFTTKLDNIDFDFWGDIFLYDLEECVNNV